MVGTTHISGGSMRVKEKALPDPHQATYSDAGVIIYGFQMRGLETIFVPQYNGQGPDSFLIKVLIFIWVHVYMV